MVVVINECTYAITSLILIWVFTRIYFPSPRKRGLTVRMKRSRIAKSSGTLGREKSCNIPNSLYIQVFASAFAANGKKKRGRPRTNPRKGEKWKLADLVKSFPTECITVFIYGKLRAFHVVTRNIWIRDVAQKVRVVVIQTTGEPIILLSGYCQWLSPVGVDVSHH
jgi:hypothetical protein